MAVRPAIIGRAPVGSDAFLLHLDELQQQKNQDVAEDMQRGELVWELAAAGVEAGAGEFRSAYDPDAKIVETVWSDQEATEASWSDAFEETRNADLDGVDVSEP